MKDSLRTCFGGSGERDAGGIAASGVWTGFEGIESREVEGIVREQHRDGECRAQLIVRMVQWTLRGTQSARSSWSKCGLWVWHRRAYIL